ncbi:hypothetical protein CLV34_1330 [Luteimicrobium subarcticum]|uniref:Pilus assembly protein CpaE n=1 Tax=Luteimicrobium subarcticum TaxID=620910 RepID=A0A2M8WSD4_9MICO|nr:hypothetical protein CLV34_1330 [Luteimicrobium subarcticum]
MALALSLRDAGVRWTPADGDRFVVESLLDEGAEPNVFTVSEMTIEEHRYETGSVLGFNGTTEWALDSVALEDALWLPAEHQLRALLGGTFAALERTAEGFRVTTSAPAGSGDARAFDAPVCEDAYAEALLALVRSAVETA